MNTKSNIAAIIPVRAGSRRLPNKNILPFGDTNLLIHKIRQLKQVSNLSEIVVSSDSQEMLEMAKSEGVLIHERSLKYADDKSVPFGEVVAHCAEYCTTCEHIMWAPCVCPIVDSSIYYKAIEKYNDYVIGTKQFDSLATFKEIREFLWNDNGPINYGLREKHLLSQQLPILYAINNAIYMYSRENMIKYKYFIGDNPFKLILSKYESIDIDERVDYDIALNILKGRQ